MSDLVLQSNFLQDKALEDYLMLGTGRSTLSLYHKYLKDLRDDPTALVPTSNLKELCMWEQENNWKEHAYTYDNEEQKVWMLRRQEMLKNLYKTKENIADDMLKLGQQVLNTIDPEEIHAADAVKLIVEGSKMKHEAIDKQLTLDDPNGKADSGSNFFGSIRKYLETNSTNIFIQNNNYE